MPLFTPIGGGGIGKATVTGTTGSPSVDTTTRAGKTIYRFTGSGSIGFGSTTSGTLILCCIDIFAAINNNTAKGSNTTMINMITNLTALSMALSSSVPYIISPTYFIGPTSATNLLDSLSNGKRFLLISVNSFCVS